MTSFTCPQCRGEGEEIASPCGECNGEGRLERHDEISLEVPVGIEDGTQLRISGRGQAGARGGRSGDLFVQVRVARHERLIRRGNDLLSSIRVPLTQCALGGTQTVETFDGPVEVHVPPGTQPGDNLRVRGKGVPRYGRSGRGDLILETQVDVPRDLRPEEEELMRKLAELRGEEVDAPSGIVGKIKGAFRS
jgi:molecular chaperone DnaJ